MASIPGGYSFKSPSVAVGVPLCVIQTNITPYVSTGASVSNSALPSGTAVAVSGTSYTYTRSTDQVAFTWNGTGHADINFGDVPQGQLVASGTKMGLPVGEAVVFFDRTLSEDFAWRCKQAGQLASKMRFLSAPWLGMLENDAWLRHARHANAMAQRLAKGLRTITGPQLLFPVEANGVFCELPQHVLHGLRERGWRFYTFIGSGGARFMCGWDMQPESVDALLADVRELFA